MDIEQFAFKIIENIKAFPEDAMQSTGEDSPKTVWDEYKEQVQFEEYDSFEVLQDTIRSMIEDEVNELSALEVRTLYNSIYEDHRTDDLEEMSKDVKDEILSYLQDEAESGEIEYNDADIRFYKYYLDVNDFPIEEIIDYNIITICEVIKRISPYDHLIHAYSNFTGPGGEQGVVNLSSLEEENGLEEVTFEKFEEIKKSFLFKPVEGTRTSLKGQNRECYLDQHREAITNNFKRLAELAKERELRLKKLSEEMDKDGVPMEERPAKFQYIYDEMVEVPDFNPDHVDNLELWKLKNEELIRSKVDEVIAAKKTSKGLTYLEAMRELLMELDEILRVEQEAETRAKKSKSEEPKVARSASVSITSAGKVEVFVKEPFLSAVKSSSTGKWSWGYASSDDLNDNFRPISPDDSRFSMFINEARSSLAGTSCPEILGAI